mmetsp:Transcript_24177/g.33796  ORF Transcript_24177/g.33796 Transcript_24177/m.33796 type:complete len:99 (-) Transcript_24177:241-537(-)|eukprot:CAMPEP_0185263326 /NCGR_PEP_ID=MMETSP1359-20130426/14066_1 /TAXON_ID=552665 /ORGANISM="Bigelowiella longifila, Strain CCMP242" /LENGTH=98 /DNA_ID=CAMNT_0027850769 /DNA_START=187 /DNA_END=483 /DNA_ORIENTATION=+
MSSSDNDEKQIWNYNYDAVDWTPMQKLSWYKKHRIPEWGEVIFATIVLLALSALFWRSFIVPFRELLAMRVPTEHEDSPSQGSSEASPTRGNQRDKVD